MSEVKHQTEHPRGKAVHILNKNEQGMVNVNDDFVEQIFSHPEIIDCFIVIFSMAGAFRKGKSFFLDYCLRFLYANVSS